MEPRTNKIYTIVCRIRPRVVGQPLGSAILPKRPPNIFCVHRYVYGCTTNIKINAEKILICHFLELESTITYVNILYCSGIKYLKKRT